MQTAAMQPPALRGPRLRSDLVIIKHEGEARPYFVVKDPVRGRVFGFNEATVRALSALDGQCSLDDAASRLAQAHRLPEAKLRDLLWQAAGAGLLEGGDLPAPEADPHEPLDDALGRQHAFNVFYIRLISLNPERWIDPLLPVLRLAFTRAGALLVALCVAVAASLIRAKWDFVMPTFEVFRYFAWWGGVYVVLGLSTIVHEIGHIVACRRFGGAVTDVGLAVYLFQPAAYANVSDTWLFPRRWQRVVVALGGVYVETVVWCTAVGVWYFSAPFTRTNQIAFMAALALATRIAFNLVPFLRTDGYWILMDVTGIRNLRPRAFALLLSTLPLIGHRWRHAGALSRRDRVVMLVYGALSTLVFAAVIGSSAIGLYAWLTATWPQHGTLAFALVLLTLLPMVLLSTYRYVRSLEALSGARASV